MSFYDRFFAHLDLFHKKLIIMLFYIYGQKALKLWIFLFYNLWKVQTRNKEPFSSKQNLLAMSRSERNLAGDNISSHVVVFWNRMFRLASSSSLHDGTAVRYYRRFASRLRKQAVTAYATLSMRWHPNAARKTFERLAESFFLVWLLLVYIFWMPSSLHNFVWY